MKYLELRKDYLLDYYVIIATERAKRPDQFKKNEIQEEVKIDSFGPGNEKLTPEEIFRVNDNNGNWKIRVFPNLYSAVGNAGKISISTDNTFYTYADAVGKHEIIVETPDINQQFWDLSIDRIKEVLDVFCYRMRELKKNANTKYIVIFKNHKKEAGTSIVHTHWQLVSINVIPPDILIAENKVNEFLKKNYYCPYCGIINSEKDSFRRIKETNSTISFTPYASRFIMEAWVFPKRDIKELTDLNDQEKYEIADQLLYITQKLKLINAPFNILIKQGVNNLHLHFEITPRLSTWAGFEYETGIIINPISPEDAAKFYR
ncbi:MAG: DUF4931 domain-containing protein [Candidatus Woesearchaeota archaeon]